MMQTFPLILTIVCGVLGLYSGAQLLVTCASKLAVSFGMTHLMTGLTVVAFCTSSPELASSLMAQLQGSYSDIALGNVIGTNISNTALIIGALALIRPLSIHHQTWKIEAPLALGASLLLFFVMRFSRLNRLMGLIFCLLLILYILRHIWVKKELSEEDREEEKKKISGLKKVILLLGIIAGSILLALGGYLLVKGAVEVGRRLGVSERVLGLTLVAVGTSLPEFAASCIALLKRMSDVALGNMFGSNVYNILMVLGIVSLVQPIDFSARQLHYDILVLMGLSLLICLLIFKQKTLGRLKGALLILSYGGYLYWMLR